MGISQGVEEVEETKEIKVPKVTEEPKTEIQNVGNKRIITIHLPGVKSEDDIDVKLINLNGKETEVTLYANK